MKIFVTGFHRAGTHTLTEELAKKYKISWLEERRIRWDSLEAAKFLCDGYMPKFETVDGELKLNGVKDKTLEKGFILHCPGLAHKTIELAEIGEVKWCTRNRVDIVTSMHQQRFDNMTWHLMNQFHDEFPDDDLWDTLTYDGSEDIKYGCINYHSIFLKVKDYFYEKYFKDITTLSPLEDQSYYNALITGAKKSPLRKALKDRLSYVG